MDSVERGKQSVDAKKAFVARYRQGISAKTLGKEAGVSENTILRWNRALEAVERRALTQQRRRGYQNGHDLRASKTHSITGTLEDLERRISRLEQWLKSAPAPQ